MPTYAAYDELSIYALGQTPDEAIVNALNDSGDPDAQFETARISDALAVQIERDGWNGNRQSFDVRGGEIVETTKE